MDSKVLLQRLKRSSWSFMISFPQKLIMLCSKLYCRLHCWNPNFGFGHWCEASLELYGCKWEQGWDRKVVHKTNHCQLYGTDWGQPLDIAPRHCNPHTTPCVCVFCTCKPFVRGTCHKPLGTQTSCDEVWVPLCALLGLERDREGTCAILSELAKRGNKSGVTCEQGLFSLAFPISSWADTWVKGQAQFAREPIEIWSYSVETDKEMDQNLALCLAVESVLNRLRKKIAVDCRPCLPEKVEFVSEENFTFIKLLSNLLWDICSAFKKTPQL